MASSGTAMPRIVLEVVKAGGSGGKKLMVMFSSFNELLELAASKLGVDSKSVELVMPKYGGAELSAGVELREGDEVRAAVHTEEPAASEEAPSAATRVVREPWVGRRLPPGGEASRQVRVTLQQLTGRKTEVSVKPSDAVVVLKERLRDTDGIPVEQQRMIYAGQQLDDEHTVGYYNIGNGSTVHIVLHLSGGKPVIELLGDWPAVGPVDVRLRLDAPFWSLAHAFPRRGLAAADDGSTAVWSGVVADKPGAATAGTSGPQVRSADGGGGALTSRLRLGDGASCPGPGYSHLFWEADVEGAEAWRRWGPLLAGEDAVTWRRDEAAELLHASLATRVGMPERMSQEMVEYWQPRLERRGVGPAVRVCLLSQAEVRGVARLDVVRAGRGGGGVVCAEASLGAAGGACEPEPSGCEGGVAVPRDDDDDVIVGPESCERVYVVFASSSLTGASGEAASRDLLGSPLEGGRRVSVPCVGSGRVSVLEWGGVELE